MGAREKMARIERVLLVCHGKDCKKKGAKDVARAARRTLRELGQWKSTHLVRTQCNGFCKQAPLVSLQPQNIWLSETSEQEVSELLREHLEQED